MKENNKYLLPIVTYVFHLNHLDRTVMTTNDEFYESNTNSDSDNDSALMEDAHSEAISSSITTNGSSSLSDDDNNFIIINKTKSDRIEKFLKKNNKQKLIRYAKVSGLVNIGLRKQIWPLFINAPSYCPVEFDEKNKLYFCPIDYYAADKNQIESHRFYGQVRMDVERTLKRFPPSKYHQKKNRFEMNSFYSIEDYSHSDRIDLQEELIIVIVKILIKHDYLYYYQVNLFFFLIERRKQYVVFFSF
jgi:hypothetical protein